VSRSRATLDAVVGVIQRDALIYLSYRLRYLGQMAAVFMSLALFFYVSKLVGSPRFPNAQAYFAYVVVGLAIVEVLTATLTTLPTAVRNELLTGTFERVAVSPLGPAGTVIAMTLFPLALALVVGVAIVGLATVVFGMSLAGWQALLALPAAVLGAVAFLPFAVVLAGLVLLVKQAGSGAAFVVTALSLASGAFFPVALLPDAVRWVSEVQPLTPALELLRHLLTGAPATGSPWADAARLAGFAVVLLPLSWLALTGSIDLARRRAMLTEY
jgi:ABC-type polysaccharide/polyol phosphate export permease